MMWARSFTPPTPCLPLLNKVRHQHRGSFVCQSCIASGVEAEFSHEGGKNKKKVVVVGSGWAGLGAAYHLTKQGFDVTVLKDVDGFGGPDYVGLQGYWYPYRNIFSLVDELGIKPFTNWTKSAQYSPQGLEVKFPVFQDEQQLPAPLGTLFYTQFPRVPLVDRLTALPLMAAVIDFDNTDTAWRKYDSISARELLQRYGCSERLYRDVFSPLFQVGLFAPPEQCSAAATLAMLNHMALAHQKDLDMVWCCGTVKEKIFDPWIELMSANGCQFLDNRKVVDLSFNEETGAILEVLCSNERYKADGVFFFERYKADAVILAVGISSVQELVKDSAALSKKEEFQKVMNLAGIDVLTINLKLDRKVNIPNASNACAGFDSSLGFTFYDLNAIYDEHKDSIVTILQADFYHANELLPLKDDHVVTKAISYLSHSIKDLEEATVVGRQIERFPKSLTHYFPGSYRYMMRGSTSFPNLFMAGDWIITRHGSWSRERSYVTGLEAANRVVDFLQEGSFARIIPVEEDEPHIQALRNLNRSLNEFRTQLPFSDYFIQ